MTQYNDFQTRISQELSGIKLLLNEPMSSHTSFRIGGPAEIMAFPSNREQLAHILHVSKLLDTVPAILGAGTNILAPDAGIPGIVICLKDALNNMEQLDDRHIRVDAGVTMTRAAVYAASLGLSGMEFAHGIPGTVGGGIYMNAGAYGGEMKDIVESVEVMDPTGTVQRYTAEQMGFSYRHSRLEGEQGIVLSAVLRLQPAPQEQIHDRMQELKTKRIASQPLELPSAGSAFKRPVGGYAAALIDAAGLKGFQIGGAAVSEKHAGFVVNLGNASAADVKQLLQRVSDIVFDHSGIRLEPEVRIW